MLTRIVLIRHPKVPVGPFRALHFMWRGRPYYVVLDNVGAGRTAFGYADGIVVIETCEQVTLPQYVVEDTAALVDSLSAFEGRTHRFLIDNSVWFRNPDPAPTMPVTPSAEETRASLAGRSFGPCGYW